MKNNFNILISLFVILIILTYYSCQKDNIEGKIINDPVLIENLYRNSSDTVIIDNQKLILEPEIYRNFFPGGPIKDKDRRLIAQINIVNIDSNLITQNFFVSKLYVINEDQAWSSKPKIKQDEFSFKYKTYLVSTGGPEWKTGIYVDVVISITDLTNNNENFLIAKNQIIKKIE